MPALTPTEFISRWSQVRLMESQAAQSHFNDVCALIGHAPPIEADPLGEYFTFEERTTTPSGQKGWADVYYANRFVWEYKGPHANLEKAYEQLQRYREDLGNPPLLITSDLRVICIHTNFTNTIKQIHEVNFDNLENVGLDLLRRAFFEPQSFKPAETQQQVTKASADTFVKVADTLKKWAATRAEEANPERLAHFLIRLLFCLFAEDLGLLPGRVFTNLAASDLSEDQFRASLQQLFAAMRAGNVFGRHAIRHFDGGLFDDDYVPTDLPGDVKQQLLDAARQDWSGIDPSIFGTLFERVIDESKRAKLGAHYTSKEDIELIVQPVLMQPLVRRWQEVKREVGKLLRSSPKKAHAALQSFADELAATRVLDPACGSGNFLYVALQQLLALQKEVIVHAMRNGLLDIALSVGPQQLYGIEINPYAHELAQVTVWIGYLQWRFENGFQEISDPILRPLKQIERKDAILAFDEDGKPIEPEWPEVDVIIGNPPFMGGKRMRTELGDAYVDSLFELWSGQVPREADLVCYWFERARQMNQDDELKRAGLLATQGIRGGANRRILERIKDVGDIFWAYSDRNWVLDGAMVHVSMVGFDGGHETTQNMDDRIVSHINSDLTSSTDLTTAKKLSENSGLSFMGVTPAGPFDIQGNVARTLFVASVEGTELNNRGVVRPYFNATDLTKRK